MQYFRARCNESLLLNIAHLRFQHCLNKLKVSISEMVCALDRAQKSMPWSSSERCGNIARLMLWLIQKDELWNPESGFWIELSEFFTVLDVVSAVFSAEMAQADVLSFETSCRIMPRNLIVVHIFPEGLAFWKLNSDQGLPFTQTNRSLDDVNILFLSTLALVRCL